jgi:hypothetical protein
VGRGVSEFYRKLFAVGLVEQFDSKESKGFMEISRILAFDNKL